jgi:hypothetical protein
VLGHDRISFGWAVPSGDRVAIDEAIGARNYRSRGVARTLAPNECALVRRAPRPVPTDARAGRYHHGNEDLGARVPRPWILAAAIAAGSIALYSCSMQASVTTDGEGRIVGVSALRIESSLARWAVEMLIVGGQLAIELRPTLPSSGRMRTHGDCPADGDGVGDVIAFA